jgi:hypothetical protein
MGHSVGLASEHRNVATIAFRWCRSATQAGAPRQPLSGELPGDDRTRILDLASEEFGIRLDEMGFDPRRMERLAEIGLMTAGIIHDVGNLMQIINAGARLAASKLESGAKTEAVDALAGILQTANRASALSRTLVYRASATRVVAQATDLSSALAGMERALTWAAGPSVQLEIAVLSSKLSIACDIDSLEDALGSKPNHALDCGGQIMIPGR